ncbi:MAG TPA: glycosyltransferase family 2 protein [Bacteroidales bacterium]|nr:glycosyltransferase family 2 protein [Bacteroidales bacterium]
MFRPTLKTGPLMGSPLVSILIPARNEGKNIQNLLQDLTAQSYPNLEIIICNDHSEDNTRDVIIKEIQKDSRIHLIDSEDLPSDWLGKNWACHQLAQTANGEFFLFLDADVRVEKTLVEKTMIYSQKQHLGLLSIFPAQEMLTIGEYNTVPLMHYILVTLLPLPLVLKSKYASLAAANGQFMLFDASIYKQEKPHEKVKKNKVEDIRIAQNFKKSKINTACITGIQEIRCRMYQSYQEGIMGFSKNMVTFFGNSYLLAFLFWGLTTLSLFLVPIFGTMNEIILFFTFFILTKIFFSLTSKQNVALNLLYTLSQHFTMLIILIFSIYSKFTKTQQWKGRSIS